MSVACVVCAGSAWNATAKHTRRTEPCLKQGGAYQEANFALPCEDVPWDRPVWVAIAHLRRQLIHNCFDGTTHLLFSWWLTSGEWGVHAMHHKPRPVNKLANSDHGEHTPWQEKW